MKGQKIVVTGGAGFIGSHIVEELIKDNEVTVIDNFYTGKQENLQDCLKDINFVHGDIRNLNLLKKVFKNKDYVFHLAAEPNVQRTIKSPLKSQKINILGTLNVLLASRDCGVKKVIYSSSSAVYGLQEATMSEYATPNPQSPYAIEKLCGEYYCKIFTELYNLPTLVIRFFNVYGHKQPNTTKYAAVIPKFINYLINNKSPEIYGNGEQTRDFIYVKDAVKITILSAKYFKNYKIINVGTGKSTTINELFEIISNIIGSSCKPIYIAKRYGEPTHSVANITTIKKELSYRFQYTLEKGLRETIKAHTVK